jgi:hypothetical protein
MPVVAIFDGIKIELYFNDHAPPHVHAKYNEYEALITILETTVFAGYLPGKQLKMAKKYVTANRQKLLERWQQYNPG